MMQPQTGSFNHQNRDVTIKIRAHQGQQDLIDQAAEAVLLERRLFMLDDEKFQQFIELLDEPPTTNANLRNLLTTKAPWKEWESGA
jgi:uncharacterized protein (DUF1778 family)